MCVIYVSVWGDVWSNVYWLWGVVRFVLWGSPGNINIAHIMHNRDFSEIASRVLADW